jgi:hypothetical protein
MLSRDENVVDRDGLKGSILLLLILDNNLRLAIRTQPWDFTVLSLDSHHLANLIGENVRVRVEDFLVPFVSSISEHETLITSAHIELILRLVHCGSNVGILRVHINNNLTVVAVKTDLVAREADFPADATSNFFKVDLGLVNAHFTKKDNLYKR